MKSLIQADSIARTNFTSNSILTWSCSSQSALGRMLILWTVALFFAAVSVPGQNVWSGFAGTTNWSSPGNWNFGSAPGAGDTVQFDNSIAGSAAAVVDNIVDANFTINSLFYKTTNGFHTTLINPGLSLNINGTGGNALFVNSGLINAGAIGTYSRWVGPGTLTVTNPTGIINTSQGGDNNDHFATLDLSGLTNFAASVGQIFVGCIADTTTYGTRPMGILRLASTNYIQTAAGISQPGIMVASYPTSDTNLRGTEQLFLGQYNVISSDTICVGGTKTTGAILSGTGLTSAQAILRGSAGGSDKVKILSVGDGRAGMANFNPGGTSASSTGTFNASGTFLDALVQDLYVARCQTNNSGSTTGTLTLDQGSIVTDNLLVGWHPSPFSQTNSANATGTVNVNGTATLTVNNDLVLSRKVGTNIPVATLNLSSNALVNVKGNIVTSNGISTINFNGGGIINLQPDGDSAPGFVSVGTLLGNGTITNATAVTNTAALTPGAASTAGTLNIYGSLTLATNATFNVNLTGAPGVGNDLVNITGDLILNSNNLTVIPLSSSLAASPNTYTLMNYTGSRSGYLNFTNPTRYTTVLDYPANQVNLVVSGSPGSLKWNATTSGAWDLATSNWVNTSTAAADKFLQLDSVMVDDSVTATNTVYLTTALYPSSVTLNSSTRDYTFGGSGKLSGGASLTKTGISMLTVSNANDFTGPVQVNGGTLRVINASALGATNSGTTIANGATLDVFGSSLYNPGELITIAGTGLNNTGAVINTGAAVQNGIRYLTLSGDATIRGDNRFDIRGPGGNSSFSAALNLNGFTLTKLGASQQSLADVVATNAGSIIIGGGTLGLTRSQIDGPGYINVLTNVLLFENSSTGYLAKPISVGGGIIRATGSAVTVGVPITNVSGVTMDTGIAFNNNGVISGAGALTKIGSATLTLNAANTYTGPTIVSIGRLSISTNGSVASPSIAVAAGATLEVSNVLGGFVLAGNQTLSGSGGVLGDVSASAQANLIPGSSPGTLSFSNNLTLNGVTNLVELGSDPTQIGGSANDLITVSGNLTLNGINTIKIIPIAPLSSASAYTVLTYSGSLAGGLANLQVVSDNPRYAFAIVDPATTPGSIQVSVSGVPTTLVWHGGASGNPNTWNNTTANWYNGGSPDTFFSGDNVQFDDTATTPLVTVAGTEQPGSMAVNNSALTYVLTGPGSIVAGSLTKQGSSPLVVGDAGPNSFAAGAALSGGDISFTNGGGNSFGAGGPVALSAGSLTFANNGENDFGSGMTIDNGTVTIANTVSNFYGPTLVLNSGSLVLNQSVPATIGAAISDSAVGGSLVKQGPNLLTLAGNNIGYDGPIFINSGMLRAANNNALGNANGATTVAPNATLDLNGSSLYNPGDVINISGFGLSSTGAVINTGGAQNNGIRALVLGADSAIGAWANRWDVRGPGGSGSYSGLVNLNSYTLFKLGSGTNSIVDSDVTSPGSIVLVGGPLQLTRCMVDGTGVIDITNNLLVLENYSLGYVNKPIVSRGGFLRCLGNSFTLNSPITNTTGLTVDVASGITLTSAGTILGAGSYTKITAGTHALTATDNAWSQGTTISAGTLQIGSGANDGSLPDLAITNNGTLTFNTLNDLTLNSQITGSGALNQISGGTVFLNASNSYAGQTTINSSTANSLNGAALRISNPYALGTTAGNTHITGNTTGNGRLELVGNITVAEPLQVDCRQAGTIDLPAVLNVSGTNTITGNVAGNTGGSDMNFSSDGGKLVMTGSFNAPNSAGTRRLKLMGTAYGEWSGVISNSPDGITAATIVVKTNFGTWTLSAINAYTGPTIIGEGTLALAATGAIYPSTTIDVQAAGTFDISAVPAFTLAAGQTLKGDGTVVGAVNVGPGATVAAGESVGVLTFSNLLVFAGTATAQAEIDKANTTNDLIVAPSITYGGTLVVTEISGTPLALGDTFKLFRASSYNGAFTTTSLPALDTSLRWDLSQLTVDGTIRVSTGGLPTTPTNITWSVSGNQLTLNWPTEYTGWLLQVQTNHLSSGISANAADWGVVPGSGSTHQQVITIDPAKPAQFYRLAYPN